MSLTTLVSKELDNLLTACETTYNSLDQFIVGKRTETKQTQRIIRDAREKIRRARFEYSQLISSQTQDFSLENMLILHKSFLMLEQALPDQETTKNITDVLFQSLDRTTEAIIYDKVRSGLPYSATLDILSSISAFYLGSPLAGAVYGSGAAAGIWEMFSKKDSFKRTLWTNAGNLMGALALLLTHETNSAPYENNLLFLTVAAHFLTYFQIQFVFRYGAAKAKYNQKSFFLQNVRLNFDNLMKTGTMIPEAITNLTYVGNIRRRQNRSNMFRGQIARLEGALIDYFRGRATLDEVIAARIKYTPGIEYKPKVKQKVARPAVAYGTTPEQEQAPHRKRYKPERTTVEARPILTEQYKPPVQVSIVLAPNLSQIYDTRQQTGGYSIKPLIDLTRTKIERNPDGEVIKNSGTGQHLLRRLKSRHDLPPGLTIYKMQPIGSLRALYTKDGSTITLLEILTHPQYERMMNPT